MYKYSQSSAADVVIVSSLPAHRTTASVSSTQQTTVPQRSLHPWLLQLVDNQH